MYSVSQASIPAAGVLQKVATFLLWWRFAFGDAVTNRLGGDYNVGLALIVATAFAFVVMTPIVLLGLAITGLWQTITATIVIYLIFGVIYRLFQRSWGI